MLKLIKYEIKKQMSSKLVMAIVMVILAAFMIFFTAVDNMNMTATFIMFLSFAASIMMCYSAIEGLVLYERDLTKKQGYMLFMLPRSAYEIVGAKMIAAIVSVLLTMIICSVTAFICITFLLAKNGTLYDVVFRVIPYIMSELMHIDFSYSVEMYFKVFALLFLIWCYIIFLAMLVTTVSKTVFATNKIAFIATVVIGFIVILLITTEIIGMITTTFMLYALFILIDLAAYFITSWLIDNKLSF